MTPNPIESRSTPSAPKIVAALFLFAFSAALLTGCARLSGFLAKPQTESRPVLVPSHFTNVLQTVQQPAQVTVVTQQIAGQTYYVTNTVQLPPVILTNTILVPSQVVTQQVVTGYVANPSVISGLAQAQGWNSTLNPTPSAPLVNIGFGLLTALATGFAGWKTKQLQSQPKIDALQSVIKAVETFAVATPGAPGSTATPLSPEAQLKAHISTMATLDQTETALAKEVKAVTNS